jgi:hypothetical protein
VVEVMPGSVGENNGQQGDDRDQTELLRVEDRQTP